MYRSRFFFIGLSLGLVIAAWSYVVNVTAADNYLMARSQSTTLQAPGKAGIDVCKRAVNDNCISCHEKEGWLKMKYVHGPLGMNQCAPCHEGKNNQKTRQFKQETRELCFYCHEEDRVTKGHEAKLTVRSDKCLYCHNPHASEKEYFLR